MKLAKYFTPKQAVEVSPDKKKFIINSHKSLITSMQQNLRSNGLSSNRSRAGSSQQVSSAQLMQETLKKGFA